jgi:hypothetical protein
MMGPQPGRGALRKYYNIHHFHVGRETKRRVHHRKVVCGIAGSELIFFQNRNHLWAWKGGGARPKRMGQIDYKDMPPLKDILGFVPSKGRITLVAKNNPPSLVFLGGQEHVVDERKVGSIFLSNKVSKKKVRDDD